MIAQIGRTIPEGDSNTRLYHTRIRLTERAVEPFMKGDPEAVPFADAALEIDGVEGIILFPYTLAVKKAEMWEWDEIEPHIKALLVSFMLPAESVNKP